MYRLLVVEALKESNSELDSLRSFHRKVEMGSGSLPSLTLGELLIIIFEIGNLGLATGPLKKTAAWSWLF